MNKNCPTPTPRTIIVSTFFERWWCIDWQHFPRDIIKELDSFSDNWLQRIQDHEAMWRFFLKIYSGIYMDFWREAGVLTFGHTASNGCRRIHGMEWTKANGHPMNTRRASQRIENIGFLAIVEDWLFLQFVFIWRIITSLKPVGEMILGVVLKTKQRAYCKIKYMEVNLFANENETVKAHVLCFCSWCT